MQKMQKKVYVTTARCKCIDLPKQKIRKIVLPNVRRQESEESFLSAVWEREGNKTRKIWSTIKVGSVCKGLYYTIQG